MASNYGIVIHGGAGIILRMHLTDEMEADIRGRLKASLETGYSVLKNGGNATDATQAAVLVMEDSPLFNAGKGAVFTHDGDNEQDASIMDGRTLECGGVTCVRRVKNPIKLARMVMDKSDHVLLAGDGAEQFGKMHGIELVDKEYFFTERRWDQLQKSLEKEKTKGSDYSQLDHTPDDKHGTVGAVAVDKQGNLAAATSSGGMTNKKYGRVGDSPIIGIGNYANNTTCAVSTTGHGEYFMRAISAYNVSALMEYKGMMITQAADVVIHNHLTDFGGSGGLVAIDARGNVAMPFNSPGMYRGFYLQDGKPTVYIFKEE